MRQVSAHGSGRGNEPVVESESYDPAVSERVTLVYGEIDGWGLVFIPQDEARELSDVRRSLADTTTWGQLKTMLSQRRWEEVLAMTREEDEPKPDDSKPFDADEIGSYSDGNWPEWPAQEMLRWMVPEVRDRFGDTESSVLNGDALAISPSSEDAVVAALEASGYACVRDDSIVRCASGY